MVPRKRATSTSFKMKDIPGDTSFLEMLDILNEQLVEQGKEPVVFDHDCREGICGMCSLTSMAILTDQPLALPLARYICAALRMVTPSPLSLGVQPLSLSSRIVW